MGEVFFEGILVDIPSSKVDLRLVYAFGGKYGLGFQKDESCQKEVSRQFHTESYLNHFALTIVGDGSH